MDYESATSQEHDLSSSSHNQMAKRFKSLIILVCVLFLINLTMSSVALHNNSSNSASSPPRNTNSLTFRLFPHQELTQGIMEQVVKHNLKAAWISTCVGSLSNFSIRFANNSFINTSSSTEEYDQFDTFEIVSLVGTMTSISNISNSNYYGAHHIHISLGDKNGKTISGHLAVGSYIYTTAEIVVGYDCDVIFYRAVDGSTPWDELQIRQEKWC